MRQVPHTQTPIDIVEAPQLPAVHTVLQAAPEFAVDVEADSMHHFRARLCFVQLGTDADIFLLDTLVPTVEVKTLAAAFADPTKTKFFHAAQGDMQYLAEAGVRVKGLFDTHRAATLLGWPKLGLVDLVTELLGATLKKEHQQADFSIRPLPPELREYIADDVRYLCDVGRMVREACVKADILEEVLLDCERMADEAAERPDISTAYNMKLPKAGLTPEQRTFAEVAALALHQKRLKWAEADDVPMGRMLSNMAIAAVVSSPPNDLRELVKREGVRGSFVRQHGDEVMALLAELKAQQAAGTLKQLPRAPQADPRVRKREEALQSWRKAVATERKVTPSVVLPNALIDDLANTPPATVEALALMKYVGAKRVARDGAAIVSVLSKQG